jgi:hypothetical protein
MVFSTAAGVATAGLLGASGSAVATWMDCRAVVVGVAVVVTCASEVVKGACEVVVTAVWDDG